MILKIKKVKIKLMECIDPKTLICCDHMWIGPIFGINLIPYYCDVKQQEILKPDGKKKCKHFKIVDLSNWITEKTKNED